MSEFITSYSDGSSPSRGLTVIWFVVAPWPWHAEDQRTA